MKRMIAWVLSLSILFLASAASAVPVWTDVYNPTDIYIGNLKSWEFTHDISDNGFVPTVDSVVSASMKVSIRDDGGRRDGLEVALINQPGFWENGFFVDRLYNFSFSSNTIGVSLEGLAQLNSAGKLTVKIQSLLGDFFLEESVLTARGSESVAAVPEPGTLLLLGSGLLGLGLMRCVFRPW